MAIHDSDRGMVNVSIRLSQYIMVDRLEGNISVYMTKMGYATIRNKRYHSLTPEILAKKWGIGLEKGKVTLKATI